MKTIAIGLTIFAVTGVAGQALAVTPPQEYVLEIERKPMVDALRDLSEQTGLQISYFGGMQPSPIMVGPLRGRYTAHSALGQIVANTGSAVTQIGETTVAIVDESAKLEAKIKASGMVLASAQQDGTVSDSSSPRTESNAELRKVEEVIVTAQKRAENVKDVPISISVLSSHNLESGATSSLKDALRTVPGIAGYENPQAGMTRYTVRGVGANTSLYNGGSTVGFYLEDIPFGFVRFPVSPDANAYDLQRVEVLRGPQGTLYGASSLNGVMRIISKDADLDEFEVRTRTTASDTHDGDQSYRADLAVNVPLIPNKLALRAVGGYADVGGWVDYPQRGRKDLNGGTHKNARVKINAEPSEDFSVKLLTWISRDNRDASNASFDNRTMDWNDPTPSENRFDAYGLTLTYDFPAFTLFSATSSLKYKSQAYVDIYNDAISTFLSADLFAQEMRLSSNSLGRWKWSLGAIYRDAEDKRIEEFVQHFVFPGVSNSTFASQSSAIYGELTRTLFGGLLDLTAGLRYFEDESSSNELGAFNLATPFGKKTDNFDALTPRVVVTYRPNDLMNVYASYSQGFRSGFSTAGDVLRISPVAIPSVRPDRLDNYEIGMKGSTGNDLLDYDVAVYYMDWRDTIQVVATQIPNSTAIVNAALNSSGAKGMGVDVAGTLRITNRLSFATTASWNDLKFADDVVSAGRVLYAKGSRLSESAELTAGASINYMIPFIGGLSAHFGGSVDYISKLSNPTVSGPREGDNLTQVGATLALRSPAGWSAALFGNNLTDERGRIRQAPLPGAAVDFYRPRTVGLQVDFEF